MTATENSYRAFIDAALSDEPLGYPKDVEFVAWDMAGWERVTVENLRDGRPTVICMDGGEYILDATACCSPSV